MLIGVEKRLLSGNKKAIVASKIFYSSVPILHRWLFVCWSTLNANIITQGDSLGRRSM